MTMTHSTWQQFLHTQGATLDPQGYTHFGNPGAELQAAASSSVLADLSHHALLEISGDDAQAFLQGQVTSDVRELTGGVAQYSSHCNAKGRVLASFLLWQENTSFRLMLPKNMATDLQKRLTMFVLRAKVRITDISEQVVLLGASGPDATRAVDRPCVIPALPMGIGINDNGTLIRLGDTRFLIASPIGKAPSLWATLGATLVPVGTHCWDWLDIRAGIPVIQPQTRESFIPQMINLDKLGGIGLNKGCYVGQEVVARAHYLGKIKRHMVPFHLASDEPPTPGDTLCIQGGDGQPVGELVSAQAAPEGGYDMLAVIKDESAEGRTLCWKTPAGIAVSPLA